jgi:hypothetical protein
MPNDEHALPAVQPDAEPEILKVARQLAHVPARN